MTKLELAFQTAVEAVIGGAVSAAQFVEYLPGDDWLSPSDPPPMAVYVKVIRYDPALLESDPLSGGLLAAL